MNRLLLKKKLDADNYHDSLSEVFEELDASFDLCLMSIGGDGTILRAITYVKDLGIPIVGINTGRIRILSNHTRPDAIEDCDFASYFK